MKHLNRYLIPALLNCIVDNNKTPYIIVDTTVANVQVPQDYVIDNRITLNISANATHEFSVYKDCMSFQSSFKGMQYDIFVPLDAIITIFAKETGEDMVFAEDIRIPNHSQTNKPKLSIVK